MNFLTLSLPTFLTSSSNLLFFLENFRWIACQLNLNRQRNQYKIVLIERNRNTSVRYLRSTCDYSKWISFFQFVQSLWDAMYHTCYLLHYTVWCLNWAVNIIDLGNWWLNTPNVLHLVTLNHMVFQWIYRTSSALFTSSPALTSSYTFTAAFFDSLSILASIFSVSLSVNKKMRWKIHLNNTLLLENIIRYILSGRSGIFIGVRAWNRWG